MDEYPDVFDAWDELHGDAAAVMAPLVARSPEARPGRVASFLSRREATRAERVARMFGRARGHGTRPRRRARRSRRRR